MTLRVSNDLSLPLDVAGEAIGLLATRGAGKSYTSAVLVEELQKEKIQTVVLDPTGVYWGLRGSGEKKGLPMYVFGGEHGDLPLEGTAGGLLADLAVDQEQSFVLDLSGFDTKAEQTRFVTAFAERLYRRKAQNRTPLVLVIDEADEFAPQRPMRDEPRMLGAMEAIVRRGRSRGLGCVLITQRSAALNKNVLDLVETLFIMRTLGPRDRKAIEGWIDVHEAADELGVLESLPSLPTGSAWVWSPVRDILKKVEVRRIRTFDSYRTPKPGEQRQEPKEIVPIDLAALGEKMAATVEQAKQRDPAELRKRISELERDLAKRPTEEVVREVEVIKEVPMLDGQIGDLESAVNLMRDEANALGARVDDVLSRADAIIGAILEHKRSQPAVARDTRVSAARTVAADKPVRARPAATSPPPEGITQPQQKILDAARWLESVGIEGHKIRVGFLAGYSPNSGNFNNLLGQLRAAGMLDYPRPSFVELTPLGRAAAAEPEHTPTTADLHEKVMAKLNGPQSRVLRVMLDAYPDELSKDAIAQATDYSANSGNFNNILGSLRKLALIDYPQRGYARAEDVLFIE